MPCGVGAESYGCCEDTVCQYDGGQMNFRCLEPWIPEPHYHIECGAWGHIGCETVKDFCCEDNACVPYPDVEGYFMCAPSTETLSVAELLQ